MMEQMKPIGGSASGLTAAAAPAPAPASQAMLGIASGYVLPVDNRATFNPADLVDDDEDSRLSEPPGAGDAQGWDDHSEI